ncbi:MAG: beta-ketoacyl-ACP reductase [Alphaproteobacteria bacterium]|nr:beta-ketoacyl-ACP reductase [Alphaproteobacteria bacterium]
MTSVAIVTGGTRGIGLEISKALAADGFQVAAIYHGNEGAAKAFKEETGQAAFKADVSKAEDCAAVVEKIEKKLGPVTVLVNNAGITRDGMLHKMSDEDWHSVIETNLTSCFLMTRAVIKGMRDRAYGRVINISSINAQKGQLGQANYSAAKAGMIGFTKALALESARKNITVNAVCPGYIKTDMTAAIDSAVLESIIKQIPAGRMGKPSEIAGIVSFLASDKASFINGATISANGGQYMA